MANVKRSGDLLSADTRKKSIDGIIEFFRSERDETIGIIAAENLLDHFLHDVGTGLYNKGVEDAKAYMKARFEDSAVDMDALLKKTQ